MMRSRFISSMVNSSYILLQIYVEVLAVCDASMETSHLENAPARRNSALRDLQSQREIATQVLSLHTPSQVLAAKRKVGALSEAALVRAAVTLGLSAVGGNTYQLPSSCLKKNNARTPPDDDVSTYTYRRPPNRVRLNLVT